MIVPPKWSCLIAACSCLLMSASLGTAQEPVLTTSRHEIHMNGRSLLYTARAGFIPIRNNEDGETRGNMFFVAYSADRGAGARRPITFLWNGGPGANSVLVHLVGFGPRRLRSADDPAKPTLVEPGLEDNEATWLDMTDLVFVDPIGTGFSRPTKPGYGEGFYSTVGDIASVAEFIRVYGIRFDLGETPIFLAGESYGTWRASGVAEALEKHGQKVAGVMLISGGIQMGPVLSNAERTALYVPGRTAAAFYHKKLAPELLRNEKATLREVEEWALHEYAPAWEQREKLADAERDKIVAQLARYTGVEPAAIDRKTLGMTSPQFRAALLRDHKQTLGRYDMRLTSPAPENDGPARSRLIARYLRNDLQFKTELAYQGLEAGYVPGATGPSVGERWKWDQGQQAGAAGQGGTLASSTVGSGDGPPGGSQPWLRRALTIDPSLRVFVAAGQYDSLNSCAGNDYLVAHVEPRFRANFTTACYPAGHMMYDTKEARWQLKRDMAAFIQNATMAKK